MIPPERPSTEETPASNAGPTGTILLVEDEPSVRALLVAVLADRGYRVIEAPDAEAALAAAAQTPRIDLLITDVRLPGMNGLQLVEQLGTPRPDLKVIYMSGFSDDLLADPSTLSPGRRILEKPFRTAHLLEMLDALLA